MRRDTHDARSYRDYGRKIAPKADFGKLTAGVGNYIAGQNAGNKVVDAGAGVRGAAARFAKRLKNTAR